MRMQVLDKGGLTSATGPLLSSLLAYGIFELLQWGTLSFHVYWLSWRVMPHQSPQTACRLPGVDKPKRLSARLQATAPFMHQLCINSTREKAESRVERGNPAPSKSQGVLTDTETAPLVPIPKKNTRAPVAQGHRGLWATSVCSKLS